MPAREYKSKIFFFFFFPCPRESSDCARVGSVLLERSPHAPSGGYIRPSDGAFFFSRPFFTFTGGGEAPSSSPTPPPRVSFFFFLFFLDPRPFPFFPQKNEDAWWSPLPPAPDFFFFFFLSSLFPVSVFPHIGPWSYSFPVPPSRGWCENSRRKFAGSRSPTSNVGRGRG